MAGVATAVTAAAQQAPPPPSAAAPNDAQLREIVEAQQRRLDAQEAVLAEQQRALQQLRSDLDASPAPAAKAETPAAGLPALTTSEEAAAALEWPGSFAVPGTKSRLKIGGFAEFDAVYDNNAILTPTSFVTNSIVTRDATPAQGEDGQAAFSVQPSRLTVEWRMPLSKEQRVKAFLSIDMFGTSTSASNSLRVREAYGEVTKVLFGGDLLLGQTWSTFRNNQGVPGTLDFQGPNSVFGVRHPLARWTKKLGSSPLTLKIAVEAPDKRTLQNAQALSGVPDGALALVWDTDGVNLQLSGLVRSLRASVDNASPISTVGWGAALAGRIYMPGALENDFLTFSVTYGKGIGGVVNDAPLDASYDADDEKLRTLPTFAYYVGYQHWWTTWLYSVACYADVWQDNLAFQAGTSYQHTRYASLNLAFTPSPAWLFGVEGLYGSRKDKDDEQGWDARGLFVSRFIF
ncbi:MAG TPA: DcaP family trimeric outer membrane transporter [Polyangiales bacterium]|nr:DcaP family trimeric outer membrane transporter [Polyangiales bacterium]